DVLPVLEGSVDKLAGGIRPADDLDDHRDLRIFEDGVRVGRDRDVARFAGFLSVAHRRGDELHRSTGRRIDAPGTVGAGGPYRRAHGAEAKEPDADRMITHVASGRPQTTFPATGTTTRSMPSRRKSARTSAAKPSVRLPSVTRESALVLWSARMKSSTD